MMSDYEDYIKEELEKAKAENLVKQRIINELNMQINELRASRVNPAMLQPPKSSNIHFDGVIEGQDELNN